MILSIQSNFDWHCSKWNELDRAMPITCATRQRKNCKNCILLAFLSGKCVLYISVRSIWSGVFTKNVLFHLLISRPFGYLKFIKCINSRMLHQTLTAPTVVYFQICTTNNNGDSSVDLLSRVCVSPFTASHSMCHGKTYRKLNLAWNKKLLLEPWN